MSSHSEPRSQFMRFLDAFLHEDNIKWLLGAGVCILIGSSLRLVTMHWNECAPVWKYLILVGYSLTVYLCSEMSYFRLGLRKTGTVLMALTILLIPLSFMALHWVRPRDTTVTTDLVSNAWLSGLLIVNLVWSAFASQRIFRHFLRQTQPSFLMAFLALCVAGAVLPGLPVAWAPALTFGLWGIFTAGTIKVNRHVFWLAEAHRLPRIFGFFPILLLGAQFATVVAFSLAGHLTLAWTGFLATIVALPILLTADTVARVFEQRTGGIVRPIPWSIIGPLVFGTTLCFAGVILSLTGFPTNFWAVPTAAIAALMLAVVAQRTRNTGFVWGMVVCILIAYQTSPVFFKDLLLQIRDQAASAINERRLPYAFYGLTYAPLIVVFTALATWLQKNQLTLFARPLRITACALAWILFGASFAHPSAVLPVALILFPIFIQQAVLFRQQLLMIPAALSCLACAYGSSAFCERVLGLPISPEVSLLIWTATAGFMFFPGMIVDRWSRVLRSSQGFPLLTAAFDNVFQLGSCAAVFTSSLIWVRDFHGRPNLLTLEPSIALSVLISTLLLIHSLRWRNHRLSEWTLGVFTYFLYYSTPPEYRDQIPSVSTLTTLLIAQWLLSYVLKLWPHARISQAFSRPLMHVSFCGLSLIFALYTLNWLTALVNPAPLPWMTGLVVLIWGLDAARRSCNRNLAAVAWCSLFLFATAAFTQAHVSEVATHWWMVVWTAVGFILLILRNALHRSLLWKQATDQRSFPDVSADAWSISREKLSIWLSPLEVILPILFVGIAVANVCYLGWPFRVAGVLAICGILSLRHDPVGKYAIPTVWPLANWQLLVAFLTAYVPIVEPTMGLTIADLQRCALPLAAIAAISITCFEGKWIRDSVRYGELMTAHQLLLLGVVFGMFAAGWQSHTQGQLGTVDICCGFIACFGITAHLILQAVREQRSEYVWGAVATLFSGLAYFAAAGVLDVTSPVVPYGSLLAACAFWTIGSVTAPIPRFNIVSHPFRQLGYWLPLSVVPIALWRHRFDSSPGLVGLNSLPLLGSSLFYFWRSLQTRQLGTAVLSAAILNLATALVWRDLHWTDPQLFLIPVGISMLAIVELLNREIPPKHHDRLRLASALLILVSPTFQILGGSWTHILTLMVTSVAVALIAIGCRVRILLYTSSAFLLADLVALVARGSMDQPNLLWIVGVGIGASVIALAAICENHRETILSRLRGLAAELEMWR